MFALWPHVLLGHLIDPWRACSRKQKSLWVGVGVWSEAQHTETYFTNSTYMTTTYQPFNLAVIYLVELYFFVKKTKTKNHDPISSRFSLISVFVLLN